MTSTKHIGRFHYPKLMVDTAGPDIYRIDVDYDSDPDASEMGAYGPRGMDADGLISRLNDDPKAMRAALSIMAVAYDATPDEIASFIYATPFIYIRRLRNIGDLRDLTPSQYLAAATAAHVYDEEVLRFLSEEGSESSYAAAYASGVPIADIFAGGR